MHFLFKENLKMLQGKNIRSTLKVMFDVGQDEALKGLYNQQHQATSEANQAFKPLIHLSVNGIELIGLTEACKYWAEFKTSLSRRSACQC